MKLPNKPKVLASTYNPVSNTKMISFLVDFPTVLLAELRTHRILTQGSLYEHSELVDFNLSANSARAIPHNKYLEKVLNNPYVPIWTKQQKGMSGELVEEPEYYNYLWKTNLELSSFEVESPEKVIDNYKELIRVGAHKQNANRLLAPFAYTTCIISGTEFDNFFSLRCPHYVDLLGDTYYSKKAYLDRHGFTNKPDGTGERKEALEDVEFWQSINKSTAQPEFQIISEMLYDLYQEADWKESKYHIPFEDEINKMEYLGEEGMDGIYGYIKYNYPASVYSFPDEYEILLNKYKMLISASMCAKLSYNTQDNEDTLEKHIERANILIEHKHQEPFSHQAVAMDESEYKNFFVSEQTKYKQGKPTTKIKYGKCWNLSGFISQRYILENF